MNKSRRLCSLLLLITVVRAHPAAGQGAGEGPQPRVVEPGGPGKAPSDAIALFNGKNMQGWVTRDGKPGQCAVSNGVMSCRTGAGDILSEEKFRSAQIHLEFAIPNMPEQKGQLKGNSGVYLHGCYELQVLDSYRNPTYPNGACGALYGISPPLVNASRPPGEWQSYDIIIHAPKCEGAGKVTEQATVTVLHNGVLIQDNVRMQGPGPGCTHKNLCEPGPLLLQDHSGFPNAPDTTMKFRNIWLRKLD